MAGKTLYDKLWESHVVREESDGTCLLYIDRHLVHEVTSAQAYEGMRLAGRKIWRKGSVVANPDHNTPTKDWDKGIEDPISRLQVETLDSNIKEFGALVYFPFKNVNQGIIHVIGPENGTTLPGMTVVCGDSHTSTHGAFGAFAHGIGTSEVEHVLATQTLIAKKVKNMQVRIEGQLGPGVTAKDVALAVIGRIGTAGGTGYAIEYAGSVIRNLSMEGRMTVCNLAIEAGARSGMVAPDEKAEEYLKGRTHAPKGENWDKAVAYGLVPIFAFGSVGAALEILLGLFIRRYHAGARAGFNRQVADSHAAFHRQAANHGACIFNGVACAAGGTNAANHGQCHILGGDARPQLAFDSDLHVFDFFGNQGLRRQYMLNF